MLASNRQGTDTSVRNGRLYYGDSDGHECQEILIRIYVKVKMFGPKMSGLGEEALKMSGRQSQSGLSIILSFLTCGTLALPSLQSERLSHNASLLDAGHVQQTAAMLANATLHTETYYGSDVKVVYRLVRSLLQHESSQQGFNLTATQDVHFTEVRRCARTRTHTHTTTARAGVGGRGGVSSGN